MCGRFTRTAATKEILADLFQLADPPGLLPLFNIAPTQGVAAVRVEYDPLQPVPDAQAAVEFSAPLLHSALGDNLAGSFEVNVGDADAAFAAADRRPCSFTASVRAGTWSGASRFRISPAAIPDRNSATVNLRINGPSLLLSNRQKAMSST